MRRSSVVGVAARSRDAAAGAFAVAQADSDGRPSRGHADRARGRDLRREPVLRPLLRDLPGRDQPAGPAAFTAQAGHARGQRADPGAARAPTRTRTTRRRIDRSECRSPATTTTTTAPSRRRSTAARWTSSSRTPAAAAARTRRSSWTTTTATRSPRCGTIAQHFAMSDRTSARPSGRRRSARSTSSAATRTACSTVALGESGTMIANAQPALDDCSAGKGAGLATFSGRNIGDLMNAAGRHVGLVRGRLQADVAGRPTATRSARATQRTPRARASTTTSRTTSRSSTTPRPPTGTTCRRPRWPRSASTDAGQPPVRPHATSTPRWPPATCRRSRS